MQTLSEANMAGPMIVIGETNGVVNKHSFRNTYKANREMSLAEAMAITVLGNNYEEDWGEDELGLDEISTEKYELDDDVVILIRAVSHARISSS